MGQLGPNPPPVVSNLGCAFDPNLANIGRSRPDVVESGPNMAQIRRNPFASVTRVLLSSSPAIRLRLFAHKSVCISGSSAARHTWRLCCILDAHATTLESSLRSRPSYSRSSRKKSAQPSCVKCRTTSHAVSNALHAPACSRTQSRPRAPLRMARSLEVHVRVIGSNPDCDAFGPHMSNPGQL